MWQTVDDIREDIKGYERRIEKAMVAIIALPCGFIDYKAHKRREVKRRNLKSDILLCRQIIVHAKEAIDRETL